MSILDAPPTTGLIESAAVPTIEVVRADSGPEFEAVLDIRRRVFGEEQGMIGGPASDQDDRRSLQALALWRPDGQLRPAGTGRLTLGAGAGGEALISWVATLPEARGRGVGRSVMAFLIEYAERAGAPVIALAAQMHAAPFYRKLDFIGTGRTYVVQGVEHRWMIRPNRRQPMGRGN